MCLDEDIIMLSKVCQMLEKYTDLKLSPASRNMRKFAYSITGDEFGGNF